MNLLDVLGNNSWVGMIKLIELTGKDKEDVREEVRRLLDDGSIIKTGKARGTKYAVKGSDEPKETSDDFSEKIRSFMKDKAEKINRKMLVQHLGVYEAKFMPSFSAMIKSGEVQHNHKKRGQVFWLAEHVEDGSVIPDPTPEEKAEEEKEETQEEKDDQPQITDIDELVGVGLKSAIIRSRKKTHRYQITELSEFVVESYSNHKFSILDVSNFIVKNWRDLSSLSVIRSRDNGHYYYYVPTTPGVKISLGSGESILSKVEEGISSKATFQPEGFDETTYETT